jgi:predicted dehydrogenase
MNREIRIAVVGAGMRGAALARQAAHCSAKVVAVAEPEVARRSSFAQEFSLPGSAVFASWEALCGREDLCDAAIIATMDHQHTAPALACLRQGWHLLLEKPLADSLEACRAIEAAQREAGVVLSVCHTLRYLESYRTLKKIVDEGTLGKLIHIEHMEAIGHDRFIHNYVRGRWSREEQNTFLLLHKCCHDIDLISWLVGEPCLRVVSFGSLSHFTPHDAPEGSGARCAVDCRISDDCRYSAQRLYVDGDLNAWPARDVCFTHTREAHQNAIRSGPFGTCVWRSGNDVVDHQTVLMEFAGGATSTCTLSGYSASNGRRTRLQGTEGELLYDEATGHMITRRFGGELAECLDFPASAAYHPEDEEIVRNWLHTVNNPQDSRIAVDAREALSSHAIVFAAERSRRERRMVTLSLE